MLVAVTPHSSSSSARISRVHDSAPQIAYRSALARRFSARKRSASTSAYDGVAPTPTTGRSHSNCIWRAVLPLEAGIAHAPSASQPPCMPRPPVNKPVAPGDLEHLLRLDAARGEAARVDLAEDAQVLARVRADRRRAGRAGRGVDARQLGLGHRQQPQRVAVAHVGLGAERQALQIGERGRCRRAAQALAVDRVRVAQALDERLQPVELERLERVAFERLELGLEDHAEDYALRPGVFPWYTRPMAVFERSSPTPVRMPPVPAASRQPLAPVAQVLSAPGEPLHEDVCRQAERAFGWSFAAVRTHAGPAAADAARALGARAFAVGSEVVLGEGVEAGRMSPTLGHELAHVVQARDARSGGLPPLSEPGDAAERSAQAAGARAAAGERAGALAPAPARLYRDSQTSVPAVKQKILAKGHADISELAALIPNSGTGKAKLKDVTIGGSKHVFVLDFGLVQQSVMVTQLLGVNAATGEDPVQTTGTPPAQTVTHTIKVRFSTGIVGDPVEVFYHELVHARILIDKSLPEADRGDTYRRYAQLVEMANDPALLAVTGTTAKKAAVIAALADLRAGVASVPGFDARKLDASSTVDAVYEFLINEKFTNVESTSVVLGKPLASDAIARRYARAARGKFERGLTGQARTDYEQSKIHDLIDGRETTLRDALLALYQALDAQLATIASAKKNGIPGASPNPQSPTVPNFGDPLLSPPLDIGGKPITTASQ